jgi:hypothetical protein
VVADEAAGPVEGRVRLVELRETVEDAGAGMPTG